MALELLLLLLSAHGLIISLYFTLVYRGVISPAQWFIPKICRLDEGTCKNLMQTPEAQILGTPNFVLGSLYYIALIFYTVLPLSPLPRIIDQALVLFSAVTVIVGMYLSYVLLFKLKTTCILCFAAHGINLGILILLLIQY